jgi:predicted exporter
MTRPALTATLIWAALVGLAALIVARAQYTTDLSAFLPGSPTAAQRLLVAQLRDGIASRLILIGVEGGEPAARARISLEMAKRLRADSLFISVNNGEPVGIAKDRELLFSHRYLLSTAVTPEHFTEAGLRDAIQDTLDLLASPAGLLAKSLLARDPTGEMVEIINSVTSERQIPTVDGVWTSKDSRRALLVAQTRALGSDIDGQEKSVGVIRRAFADALAVTNSPDCTLEMSGPGVFSVAARSNIKHEVMRLTLLSTGLLMVLLLAVYRSVAALLLGLVPVASGALAGVAAVSLGFGLVHGITLAFGVTLIGESVDYSIYLFIQ